MEDQILLLRKQRDEFQRKLDVSENIRKAEKEILIREIAKNASLRAEMRGIALKLKECLELIEKLKKGRG